MNLEQFQNWNKGWLRKSRLILWICGFCLIAQWYFVLVKMNVWIWGFLVWLSLLLMWAHWIHMKNVKVILDREEKELDRLLRRQLWLAFRKPPRNL